MISNTTQNTTSGSSPSSNLMNQISSGPAGILYTLSNELTAIYNQLQASYNEMTKAEAEVQKSTIDTSAAAQIAAARKQAWGIAGQAFGSAVSAVTTLGGFGYEHFGMGGFGDLATKVAGQENELNAMNTMKTLPHNSGDIKVGQFNELKEAAINKRCENLKEGIYTHPDDETLSKTPGKLEEERQAATNRLSLEEHNKMLADLEKKIPRLEKKINTTYTQISTLQQKINQGTQLFNNAANGVAQGVQAVLKNQEGRALATQQVTSGVTQMASSTGENTRSQIGQFFNKVGESINAASQGSKAYAQT